MYGESGTENIAMQVPGMIFSRLKNFQKNHLSQPMPPLSAYVPFVNQNNKQNNFKVHVNRLQCETKKSSQLAG